MADIDVVPKRRTNAWVWLLLTLVILAVLLLVLSADRADAFTIAQQFDPLARYH